MIGGWEPAHIERIASLESRRLAVLPVAGLSGDLHQDLGRGALAVEITGSLWGDETRDDFLAELRAKFQAGEPVDFVADIVKESELEQVLIEELSFEEDASAPEVFRYRLVLREYTEPPEPPGLGADLGVELDAELDLLAELGLDGLDLPAIAADVPQVGDLLSPVKEAADSLKENLSNAGSLLSPLAALFGGS
ncbi:hypothetical protein JY651_14555 [Pyxidicoccus parkwayensis]|uniref:Uncharacterized protein n=1 Tax=Pyxidicoccus parkwayensis TaxID=2813578 RepID=A0ABX7P6J0_9BACT|nr:hypothetical protein [Pyxidicoccus parkwaysis]QSQ26066.1 hypothetical protein JY651_14555 [Pyxidicoccus parkwaysis]